jgi:hypothetical protein
MCSRTLLVEVEIKSKSTGMLFNITMFSSNLRMCMWNYNIRLLTEISYFFDPLCWKISLKSKIPFSRPIFKTYWWFNLRRQVLDVHLPIPFLSNPKFISIDLKNLVHLQLRLPKSFSLNRCISSRSICNLTFSCRRTVISFIAFVGDYSSCCNCLLELS